MRWPIRYQLLAPSVLVLVTALSAIAVLTAVLAARRSESRARKNLEAVVDALADSRFPLTANVLARMHGLSGADFVTLDASGGTIVSTLPSEILLPEDWSSIGGTTIDLGGKRFTLAKVQPGETSGADGLVVLFPEERLSEIRRDAALPPLFVGAGALGMLAFVGVWQARVLGRRIDKVSSSVARIAKGEFQPVLQDRPVDELEDLLVSINHMSTELSAMRQRIQRTERDALLSQLAMGLAHQLRNALTGVRLSIQIHERKCPHVNMDRSLQIALKQLSLVEEQVKGLLALGRRERKPPRTFDGQALVLEVVDLLGPVAEHARVKIVHAFSDDRGKSIEGDADAIKSAVLNLVLNGIEAAGPGGLVEVRVGASARGLAVDVVDTGAGPDDKASASIFEPFVTTKPEGVGLGLALAKQVAEDHFGSLAWKRTDNKTIFHFETSIGR